MRLDKMVDLHAAFAAIWPLAQSNGWDINDDTVSSPFTSKYFLVEKKNYYRIQYQGKWIFVPDVLLFDPAEAANYAQYGCKQEPA